MFMRETGYFARHPTWTYPLKFCMPSFVWKVVIYLKFHENRLRGLGTLRSNIDRTHWIGLWLIPQPVPYMPWCGCSHCITRPSQGPALSSHPLHTGIIRSLFAVLSADEQISFIRQHITVSPRRMLYLSILLSVCRLLVR